MPLIAMNREMGSLGKDVALGLEHALGMKIRHHEIIDHIANRTRLRKSHAIRTHGTTSHCKVRVTAVDGRVSLEGVVDSIEQSEACSDITSRLKGVRQIENHLRVAEVPVRLRG